MVSGLTWSAGGGLTWSVGGEGLLQGLGEEVEMLTAVQGHRHLGLPGLAQLVRPLPTQVHHSHTRKLISPKACPLVYSQPMLNYIPLQYCNLADTPIQRD